MRDRWFAGVVTIDKHPDHHGFSKGCGCVGRNGFTGCAEELGPVMVMLKSLTINGRVGWFKNKLGVMVRF